MKIRAASLALFYVMSPVSVRLEERRGCRNRYEHSERRTTKRHGTAFKSNIPEWAGKGVGVVGIVYLVYAMPTYETVRPGDDQNVGT